MSVFNRLRAAFHRSNGLRPARRNPHLKNSDIFEFVPYMPALAALRQATLPTIIGFRIRQNGPAARSFRDPRPSFAFLETDNELAAWQEVFASNISYETDTDLIDEELAINRLVNFHNTTVKTYEVFSDKPLLQWNDKPSVLPDSLLCFSGAAFLPKVGDAEWPPLSVSMGPLNFDKQAARGRYGFEQPSLQI